MIAGSRDHEAWHTFKDWIERENPRLASLVARNLALGPMIPASERNWAALMREEARDRPAYLVPPATILCLPTTPCPAPFKGQPLPALDILRDRITCLAAHGGLAGHPQASIPGASVDGVPVGLSIIGAGDSDATLVAVAKAIDCTTGCNATESSISGRVQVGAKHLEAAYARAHRCAASASGDTIVKLDIARSLFFDCRNMISTPETPR